MSLNERIRKLDEDLMYYGKMEVIADLMGDSEKTNHWDQEFQECVAKQKELTK